MQDQLSNTATTRPDLRAGLGEAEAARRLAQVGPNLAVIAVRRSLLARIAKRLMEPLVAILLIAAVISGATGDWRSFGVIVVIVLLSTALDIAQERKAEDVVTALRRSVAVKATVRRDGALREIPVHDIVPGDVVRLTAGQSAPADGVVLEERDAMADEAALTGEPYAVEKRAAPDPSVPGDDPACRLFAGTSLVSGEAEMLVTETGARTRFGSIAASVQATEPPTAFERGVHALGMLILRLTGFLVLFVLLTQLMRQGLTLESFMFAVALAVGLTPELLPMIMTVTLASGAARMAKRKVVVKRLSAIHDLGGMDVLCTDKTGTLTQAHITHVGSLAADGGDGAAVTAALWWNSRLVGGARTNLDDAILALPAPAETAERVADLPFDFERRRSSVLLRRGEGTELVVKGAPEALLSLCDRVQAGGAERPLDVNERTRLEGLIDAKGREGLRLLGVARRAFPAAKDSLGKADESGLVFLGFAMFLDPPKASATEAVTRLVEAGVRVKIVSGDAAAVVRHLVETLKLPAKGMLTGAEIAALGDAALVKRVREVDLFVRVAPDQKSRIVRALRRAGKTVGFMGDGINDAPAIHAADVGLSVDDATDVAREAADIILLDSDLGVLADGVAEGRRTYANIMKYVRMGASSNFGNMLSMALASLVLPFLPLAPLQILLNNLLYDVSEVGIPFDQADPESMARPRAWDMRQVLRFTLIMGPLSSVFDLATFALLRLAFDADVEVFRTAWFVESITTQILVIFLIRTARPFWSSRPHPALAATSLGALAAALLIALTPVGRLLGFAALPAPVLAAMAMVSLAYLVLAEKLKRVAMRGRHGVVAP
ncbi:magnesium-translocating P-type ATPase [Alsobacter soli]|uniref:Magnesium-transporting ATPase, P-type 1 n=1 Tax=Alsobacter soli TaxID=2109933 RepID=A0A2T1HX66_9HYPH|nr:magnesium-translocating P-type ATPase [Alsobacter soli]PSC06168.1 magnesium-translocating P-type ATPase [Alsobacter soli]